MKEKSERKLFDDPGQRTTIQRKPEFGMKRMMREPSVLCRNNDDSTFFEDRSYQSEVDSIRSASLTLFVFSLMHRLSG